MKILAITQARIGSSRLPEKILMTIEGITLLEIHLKRILGSKKISALKVATTIESEAGKIIEICNKTGVSFYQGSVNNVLERFYYAAESEAPDWVVRLTSDCPLIDSELIDKVIQFTIDNDLDYGSNTLLPTYPDGQDVEVFKYTALIKAHKESELKSDIEHVTPYIWRNSSFMNGNLFRSDCFKNKDDLSALRMTVDTMEDYLLIKKLVGLYGFQKNWEVYADALLKNPELSGMNSQYKRNEGYEKSLNNDKKS